jgi:DNA-binding response OmpR family regulator
VSRQGTDPARDLVLVIEHDAAVAELARRYLEREGLSVRVARSPAEAAALRAARPAVVVLDLTMPGLSAAAVRRRIIARDRAVMPVLICLEGPGGLRSRHVGITGGAPGQRNCLTRPFSPRALVALVRSALRPLREGGDGGAPPGSGARAPVSGVRALGELILDGAARRVIAAGVPIAVTGTEFALLAFLIGNTGRVFTRQQLLSAVWGSGGAAASRVSTRTVDVYVAQLRAKLGPHSPIRTVRGVGYAADPWMPRSAGAGVERAGRPR